MNIHVPKRYWSSFHCRVPEGTVDVVLTYCHYSLNDTTLKDIVPYLKSKGVGIVNAGVLSMGLLTKYVCQLNPQNWLWTVSLLMKTCFCVLAKSIFGVIWSCAPHLIRACYQPFITYVFFRVRKAVSISVGTHKVTSCNRVLQNGILPPRRSGRHAKRQCSMQLIRALNYQSWLSRALWLLIQTLPLTWYIFPSNLTLALFAAIHPDYWHMMCCGQSDTKVLKRSVHQINCNHPSGRLWLLMHWTDNFWMLCQIGCCTVEEVQNNVRCVIEAFEEPSAKESQVLKEVKEILKPIQGQTWPSGRPENNWRRSIGYPAIILLCYKLAFFSVFRTASRVCWKQHSQVLFLITLSVIINALWLALLLQHVQQNGQLPELLPVADKASCCTTYSVVFVVLFCPSTGI